MKWLGPIIVPAFHGFDELSGGIMWPYLCEGGCGYRRVEADPSHPTTERVLPTMPGISA